MILNIVVVQMVFALTVTVEMVTGNSVFRKMDVEWITEAGGVCLAAVTLAALFAYFSSARNRVGRIFTLSYNSFIDSVIDQIVDGLFYESDELWIYLGVHCFRRTHYRSLIPFQSMYKYICVKIIDIVGEMRRIHLI